MKEVNRILAEIDDPVFLPCPTCHKRMVEIGEWCECWKEDHLHSTLELVDSIMEEYHVNGPDGRAYRLAEIIKDWREDLGI
jgi:hypothetical protein